MRYDVGQSRSGESGPRTTKAHGIRSTAIAISRLPSPARGRECPHPLQRTVSVVCKLQGRNAMLINNSSPLGYYRQGLPD